MLYLAVAQAAAWGTPLRGAASMAGFGFGTVPALAACALLGGTLLSRLGPARLRTAGAVLCILAGVVAVARAAPPLLSGDPAACCH
ncbi:MAG: hypothetical protein HMLKMBBP_00394 [Planctomycetes bacterium]|nr:hypothetical protein [Planctomycetota bacterium]